MAEEIKTPMSGFDKVEQVKDTAEIILLQDGVNARVEAPIFEQKILNKTDNRYLKKSEKIPNTNLTFGEVKEGDVNVVSGGEVYDYLINSDLNKTYTDNNFTQGYYDLSKEYVGEIQSSTFTKCLKINVIEGQKIILTDINGGNLARSYALAKSDGKITKRAGVSENAKNLVLTVEKDESFLIVNSGESENKKIEIIYPNSTIVGLKLTFGFYDLSKEYVGSVQSSTFTKCLKEQVIEGQRVYLNNITGGDLARSYAFADKNNKITRRSEAGVGANNLVIDVLVGEKYLYVNSGQPNSESTVSVVTFLDNIIDNIKNINNESNISNKTYTDNNFTQGYYDLSDKKVFNLQSSNFTKCLKINVIEGQNVSLKNIKGGNLARAYATTDANNNIIRKSNADEDITESTLQITKKEKFLYVNSGTPSELKNISIVTSLDNVTNEIQEVEEINNIDFRLEKRVYPYINHGHNSYKSFSLIGSYNKYFGEDKIPIKYYWAEYPAASSNKIFISDTLNSTPSLFVEHPSTNMDNRQLAISRHGSIISAIYDDPEGWGFTVYENNEWTKIDLPTTYRHKAQGWLYNFGYEFLELSDGEYFISGEYGHANRQSRRIFKAKYPYSNPDNWKVVHEFTNGEIHHIHAIVKDPYGNGQIYCFTGDKANESNIYISRDNGDSWELLLKSNDITPGKASLRCTNPIFLKDKIYLATDDYYHKLITFTRDENKELNPATFSELINLKKGQMTNATAYLKDLNALFFYDRVEGNINSILEYYMYFIDTDNLVKIADAKYRYNGTNDNLWGNRGRYYIVDINPFDNLLGFSISGRLGLNIDMLGNMGNNYGGVFYKIS